MSFEAVVIADSESHCGRITTMRVTYPRSIHDEIVSFRALAVTLAPEAPGTIVGELARVKERAFTPIALRENGTLSEIGAADGDVFAAWEARKANAIQAAEALALSPLNRQDALRLLEPFQWVTVLVTAAQWKSFFETTCSPDASPEVQYVARVMRDARNASQPEWLYPGQWHLPYVDTVELRLDDETLCEIATARCARVAAPAAVSSAQIAEDRALHMSLRRAATTGRHWQPFQHVARASSGGAIGQWLRYRETLDGDAALANAA